MAFFDIRADEHLSPEVRKMFEEYRRENKKEVPISWRAFGGSPKIIEARLTGLSNLFHQCSFPWEVKNLAFMLIAHSRKCQACFTASRANLDQLGWDEATLDGICARPEELPLKERDRLFVQYALKTAVDASELRREDFNKMEAAGLSKSEIQEMIAFAAYANMHVVFTKSTAAWQAEA